MICSISKAKASLEYSVVDSLVVEIEKPAKFCANDTVKLFVQNVYDSYEWTALEGSYIGSNTTNELAIDASGKFEVKVIKSQGGIDVVARDTVLIVQALIKGGIVLSNSSNKICSGDTIEMKAFGGGNISGAYNWLDPVGLNQRSVEVFPTETTVYNLKVVNSSGCETTYSQEIVVFDKPEADLVVSDLELCAYEIIYLTTNAVDDTYSYHWNTGDKSSSISKFVAQENPEYQVSITNDGGCELVLDAPTITVNRKPTYTLSSSENVVDVNDDVLFEVNNLQFPCDTISYRWSINGAEVIGEVGSSLQQSIQDIGIYNVCVQSVCACEGAIVCKEIMVKQVEDCFGLIEDIANEICVGEDLVINASAFSGAATGDKAVSWFVDGKPIQSTDDGTDKFEFQSVTLDASEFSGKLKMKFLKPGSYTIKWVFSRGGCENSREKTITVYGIPKLSIEALDTYVCKGDNIPITIKTDNLGAVYSYSVAFNASAIGVGNFSFDQNSSNTFYINNFEGNDFSFEVTDIQNNLTSCSNNEFDLPMINEKPIVQPFSFEVDSFCLQDGAFYEKLSLKGGSGNFKVVGYGTSGNKLFITDTLNEGDQTMLEISDVHCSAFTVQHDVSVFCSCKESPTVLVGDDYPACSKSSLFIPVENIASVPNPQQNITYYKIRKQGSDEVLLTKVYEPGEEFITLNYEDVLEFEENYTLTTYISKKNPFTGEPIETYNCLVEETLDGYIRFYKSLDFDIEAKDTVCVGQTSVLIKPSGNIGKNISVDFDVFDDSKIERIPSENEERINFLEPGIVQYKVIQSYVPDEKLPDHECSTVEQHAFYVQDLPAPASVDILYFEPQMLVADTQEDYDFEWGRINKKTGEVSIIKNSNNKYNIFASINTNRFIYFVTIKNKETGCEQDVFYNHVFLNSNNTLQENIVVYPNPALEYIVVDGIDNIQLEKIELLDGLGRKIACTNSFSHGTFQVTPKQQLNGIFYLNLYTRNVGLISKAVVFRN